ncbi:unnamed protein product [Trifolium pratense]|uniref:Uncharacterized protein n=1 Tax=Trifolium pratense TaxID=57577 RepID=A0ACB0KWS0_TRIPR|nr:unnamed protein product [Trifolium pratense]
MDENNKENQQHSSKARERRKTLMINKKHCVQFKKTDSSSSNSSLQNKRQVLQSISNDFVSITNNSNLNIHNSEKAFSHGSQKSILKNQNIPLKISTQTNKFKTLPSVTTSQSSISNHLIPGFGSQSYTSPTPNESHKVPNASYKTHFIPGFGSQSYTSPSNNECNKFPNASHTPHLIPRFGSQSFVSPIETPIIQSMPHLTDSKQSNSHKRNQNFQINQPFALTKNTQSNLSAQFTQPHTFNNPTIEPAKRYNTRGVNLYNKFSATLHPDQASSSTAPTSAHRKSQYSHIFYNHVIEDSSSDSDTDNNNSSGSEPHSDQEITDDENSSIEDNNDDEDLELTDQQIENLTLLEIEEFLQANRRTLKEFTSMPYPQGYVLEQLGNRLIYDERNYDIPSQKQEFNQLFSTLTDEQRKIYHQIMEAVTKQQGGVFFLHGYGGTGKTFMWRTLASALRSKQEIVLTVATSGIAALLLPGGRTAHSKFKLPVPTLDNSICKTKHDSDLANLFRATKLIIWDEAPMAHRYTFEALDRSLKDIMSDGSNSEKKLVEKLLYSEFKFS